MKAKNTALLDALTLSAIAGGVLPVAGALLFALLIVITLRELLADLFFLQLVLAIVTGAGVFFISAGAWFRRWRRRATQDGDPLTAATRIGLLIGVLLGLAMSALAGLFLLLVVGHLSDL